jgi:hypothetical protein
MRLSNPNYYRMFEHSSSIDYTTQEACLLPKHYNVADKVTQNRRFMHYTVTVNKVEQGAYRTVVRVLNSSDEIIWKNIFRH